MRLTADQAHMADYRRLDPSALTIGQLESVLPEHIFQDARRSE